MRRAGPTFSANLSSKFVNGLQFVSKDRRRGIPNTTTIVKLNVSLHQKIAVFQKHTVATVNEPKTAGSLQKHASCMIHAGQKLIAQRWFVQNVCYWLTKIMTI